MRILLILKDFSSEEGAAFVGKNSAAKFTITPKGGFLEDTEELDGGDYFVALAKFSDQLESNMLGRRFIVINDRDVFGIKAIDYPSLVAKHGYKAYTVYKDEKNMLEDRENGSSIYNTKLEKTLADLLMPQILASEVFDTIKLLPTDISKYTKVHFIGDIQGVLDPLLTYLSNESGGNPELKDDEFYVFLGDYLDRGLQNGDTLQWFINICDRPNVILVEGNHEASLRAAPVKKNDHYDFYRFTQAQLAVYNIDKKDIDRLVSKLRPIAYIKYHDKEYACTHAGLGDLPKDLVMISESECIKGKAANYENNLMYNKFLKQTSYPNLNLVHGHSNPDRFPIKVNDRIYNLEGRVEFCESLRVLTLEGSSGISKEHYIKNSIAPFRLNQQIPVELDSSIQDICKIKYLQKYRFGKLITFNYTKHGDGLDEFKQNNKNNNDVINFYQSSLLNMETGDIVTRWYPADQMRAASSVKNWTNFPINVYENRDSVLVFVGYDAASDGIVVNVRKNADNLPVHLFRSLFYETYINKYAYLKNTLRSENVSLVFDLNTEKTDRSIISCPTDSITLVDVIRRTRYFQKLDLQEVTTIADGLGVACKKVFTTLSSKDELEDFLLAVKSSKVRTLKGFLLDTGSGPMYRVSLPYFALWDSIYYKTTKFYSRATQDTAPGLKHDPFFAFYQSLSDEDKVKQFIKLRREFEDHMSLRMPVPAHTSTKGSFSIK